MFVGVGVLLLSNSEESKMGSKIFEGMRRGSCRVGVGETRIAGTKILYSRNRD
jgi:hypothetical protein